MITCDHGLNIWSSSSLFRNQRFTAFWLWQALRWLCPIERGRHGLLDVIHWFASRTHAAAKHGGTYGSRIDCDVTSPPEEKDSFVSSRAHHFQKAITNAIFPPQEDNQKVSVHP